MAYENTWSPEDLPESKIIVTYGSYKLEEGTVSNVSDAYGNISGRNFFDQNAGFGTTSVPGLHPDHHMLKIIPVNEETDSFLIVNTNDGGMAVSYDSGETFDQITSNYVTTQFYGVAKNPNSDEYIGGMQDNGTWQSHEGELDYIFQIGGDGFETVWNYNDEDKIVTSSYFNKLFRTLDGGNTWQYALGGIQPNDGPFITRVSSHPCAADVLFAIGCQGIYKSTNFAEYWTCKTIGNGWNAYADEGYPTNQHNVEISLANENIIWAGAAMVEDYGWKMFVSTDQGETFNPVNEFQDVEMDGFISGIATHPYDDSTAYLLYSLSSSPKILRTEDLGQTWEDITGFVGNTESSNGFPDVVVHSLVVLPNDPNTIWVGTDIGLFESTDAGTTWHYADNGLPPVAVYDMFVQNDQVVVATHGRGIWTATIDELNLIPGLNAKYIGQRTINTNIAINTSLIDSLIVYLNGQIVSTEKDIESGVLNVEIPVYNEGTFKVNAEAFKSGIAYKSLTDYIITDFKPEIIVEDLFGTNDIIIYSDFSENYDSVRIYKNNEHYSLYDFPFLGENEFTVNCTESGTYKIYIEGYIDGIPYVSNKEYVYKYVETVGIDDDKSTVTKYKLYPNPTDGYSILTNAKGTKVYIYTIAGSLIETININSSEQQINFTKYNGGTYIVRVQSEEEVFDFRLVVIK